jgi:hypothetical protein
MATAEMSQQEIENLFNEVAAELTDLTKSEVSTLAKAREESAGSASPAGSPSPGGAPGADASAGASPSADAGSGAPPGADDGSGSAPPMDPSAAGSPDMGAAPGADAGGSEMPPDPEAIKQALMGLPVEQIEMYFLAAKSALFEKKAQAGGADAGGSMGPPATDPSASPAPAPSAAAPAPSASPMPPDQTMKNEKDTEAFKKAEELEKKLDLVVGALEHFVGAPMRKSVEKIAALPKNGNESGNSQAAAPKLSKSEVMAKLKEVNVGGLKKSERDLILDFYAGKADVEKVQHFIK